MTKLLWSGLAGGLLMAAVPAQAQNAANGATVFKRTCSLCHSVDPGKKGLGPNLRGVIGRQAGTAPDFAFSPAIKKAGTWTPAQLKAFLAEPRKVAPGNRMAFVGMPKPTDRDDLVAWLAMQK